jgi:hypothetical protein
LKGKQLIRGKRTDITLNSDNWSDELGRDKTAQTISEIRHQQQPSQFGQMIKKKTIMEKRTLEN